MAALFVPLQSCMCCHPFLRAAAFPAPSEPLEGAVACQDGNDGMGCVSSLTRVGAHSPCAVPAGKAASPGAVNLWSFGTGQG